MDITYRYDGVVTCPECDRRFDLFHQKDADEWAHGHDCETPVCA